MGVMTEMQRPGGKSARGLHLRYRQDNPLLVQLRPMSRLVRQLTYTHTLIHLLLQAQLVQLCVAELLLHDLQALLGDLRGGGWGVRVCG